MTPSDDDRLADRLQRVDDRKLRDVVRMLESTRERNTVEPILAALRPRLRRLRPERPLTLQRLLTVPLEQALVTPGDRTWSFVIDRSMLASLHEAVLAALAPGQRVALASAIAGRQAHEMAAIVEHGSTFWPAAAVALRAVSEEGDGPGQVAIERRRAADLLAMGPLLVPLLGRLSRPLQLPDDGEKQVLADILAMALAGSADRLGTVLTLLLRSARRPAALADELLDAVEPPAKGRLRPLIGRILAEHRAALTSLLEDVEERPDAPAADVARAVERIAEAVEIEGESGDGTEAELGRRAGLVAERRCLAALEDLGTLPQLLAGDTEAVRDREARVRTAARLGRAAGRLLCCERIERATGTVVKALEEGIGELGGDAPPSAHVRVARLIEILAGPDRAWAHLSRHRPEPSTGAAPATRPARHVASRAT